MEERKETRLYDNKDYQNLEKNTDYTSLITNACNDKKEEVVEQVNDKSKIPNEIIDDKIKEETPLEMAVGTNDDNNENKEEEVLIEDNLNIINQVTKNKNIRKKDKLKSEKVELFITQKKKGPKAKVQNKEYPHTANSYDNTMDKLGRLFLNSIRCYLNNRCEKYETSDESNTSEGNKLHRINFKKLYGSGYNTHKNFLKKSLKDALSFESPHNLKIINEIIKKGKDEIFIAFMELTIEEVYSLYKRNFHYLKIGDSRRYLFKFISLEKAMQDKKNKKKINKKNSKYIEEYIDELKEKAETFTESIYKEEERQKNK